MNLLHLKYVVEIARCKSISKAAESLNMGQPNLSRSIKELEDSLGITIFNRTSKGIEITDRGDEFIQYAKDILTQVDHVESLYRNDESQKQSFSISVPRVSYISHAFVQFASMLDQDKRIELYYKETNSFRAMSNIIEADYNLGIIRYRQDFQSYFEAGLRERGLNSMDLLDYSPLAVMSKEHPLANRPQLTMADFEPYLEVAHGDPYIPSLPGREMKKVAIDESVRKRIFVFERGSQFDLLCGLNTSYMWVSPIPEALLKRYDLVQKWVSDNEKIYKDVLIFKKGYRFSELDKLFLDTLVKVKQNLKVIL